MRCLKVFFAMNEPISWAHRLSKDGCNCAN
jgi:hypothetical protein